jgi:hypothetical protein
LLCAVVSDVSAWFATFHSSLIRFFGSNLLGDRFSLSTAIRYRHCLDYCHLLVMDLRKRNVVCIAAIAEILEGADSGGMDEEFAEAYGRALAELFDGVPCTGVC